MPWNRVGVVGKAIVFEVVLPFLFIVPHAQGPVSYARHHQIPDGKILLP